jgi:hypothetical protein
MKRTAVATSSETETRRSTHAPGYCDHASARRIRVYMPYAEANTIRLRAAAQAGGFRDTHVSSLYPIPGGWGWTVCLECRSLERKSA